jgi:hypothetical protein
VITKKKNVSILDRSNRDWLGKVASVHRPIALASKIWRHPGRTNRPKGGLNEWMMNECIDEWMNLCINEWMNEWVNEWMNK